MILVFLVCARDKNIYEDTKSTSKIIEEEKDIQPENEANNYSEQINKLEKLAQFAAKKWNSELASYFYNYFSQTKQPGIELAEIKTKLEKEYHRHDDIIQLFSEFSDVHLDAKHGLHPIEIYIPRNHIAMIHMKTPIFVFDDPTKEDADDKNEYSTGFLPDGSEVKVNNRICPKDQPAIVFRFKEKLNIQYPEMAQNQQSMQKTNGSYNEEFYLSQVAFKNEGATNEPWLRWPPEYYTKFWYCFPGTGCSQVGGYERSDVLGVSDWDPDDLEDGWNDDWNNFAQWFDCFDINHKMKSHVGGTWYYERLRIELWEEDLLDSDDMVDRCFGDTDPPYLGWREWQSNGYYGYCRIKIKRYIWE